MEERVPKIGCSEMEQYKNKLTQYVTKNIGTPDLHTPPKGEDIDPTNWSRFVISRLSDQFKKTSEDHSKLRALNKYPHHMARKGYANLAEENPSLLTGDDEVDRATLWSEARKSKDGTYHSEDLKATVSKITQFVERKKSAGDSNLFHSSEDILENALESKEHAGRVRGVGGHVTPSTYFNIGKGKKVGKELLARQERFIMAQEMRLRKLEEEFYNNREGKGSCSTKGIRPCPEGEEDPLMLNDDDDDG